MKRLIVSATALTLLAGSAFAQEATTNPPPAAPAQTAPNQTPPTPPELTPGNKANTQNDDQDLQSSNGMEDQMDTMDQDERDPADRQDEARRGPGHHHWDRDRPRGHHWRSGNGGPRHGRGNEGAHFRLTTKEDSIDVMEILKSELIPIRDECQYPRLKTAHFRKPRYFIYRAA